MTMPQEAEIPNEIPADWRERQKRYHAARAWWAREKAKNPWSKTKALDPGELPISDSEEG